MSLDAIKEEEPQTFIRIICADSDFVLPIAEVKEVEEAGLIKPYPCPHQAFVGIAHLRGNFVPVLSHLVTTGKSSERHLGKQLTAQTSESAPLKLVVLNEKSGALFGLLATHVKKVCVPKPLPSSENVITLDHKPVICLSSQAILDTLKACKAA